MGIMEQLTPEILFRALSFSYSPNEAERQESETFLAAAETRAGYLQALTTIWVNDQVDVQVRQGAAIAAKNVIKKNWSRSVAYDGTDIEVVPGQGDYVNELSNEDKAFFKANVYEILVRCVSNTSLRTICTETIKQVVHRDFPSRWPQLLDQAVALVQSVSDASKVHAGLIITRVLCREFEMKMRGSGRQPIEQVITSIFPLCLSIGQSIVSSPVSADTLPFLHLIMKSFYSAVLIELSPTLAKPEICSAWLELTVKAVQLGDAREALAEEERSKVQKWSLRSIQKFLLKHGNPKVVEAQEGMTDFAKWWLAAFAPVLVTSIIQMLKDGIIKVPVNINVSLGFLSEAIQHAATFQPMKPHLELLLFHVIFPLMCFNQERKELWEDDPEEFVRSEFDCTSTFKDPRSTAIEFVKRMVNLRSGEVLAPLLKFCEIHMEEHRKNPNSLEHALRKDGALGLITAISEQLCLASSKKAKKAKSKLPDEQSIELLLQNYVIPDFKSPFGFLRYRACSTFSQFVDENLSFKKQISILVDALRETLTCLSDPDLPVRVQAGISLRAFIDREELAQPLGASVPILLEKLLVVMGEVESEALAGTLENLVSTFSEQVTPFAAQAIHQLGKQFCKLVDMDDDEANLTCMGVIQTVCTLLEGACATPALFTSIEPQCYPILDQIFRPECIDYLQEGLEILCYLTFYGPEPLSANLWKYFSLMHQSICGGSLPGFELTEGSMGGWAVDYLEEMLNCFDNFISRGTEIFLTQSGPLNVPFTEMLYQIVNKGLASENEETQIGAVRIAACVFESCPSGRVDAQIAPYLQATWKSLDDSEKSDLGRWLMYLYGTMVQYNPVLVAGAAQQLGIADSFFEKFNRNSKYFKNPDEKKVLILALCRVIQRIDSMPQCVHAQLQGYVQVLALTSKAIVEVRAKIEQARNEEDEDDDDDESDDSFDLQDLDETQDADQSEQIDMYKRLRETLAKYKEGGNDDDDDYEEDDSSVFSIDDSERTTPLDNIDEFGLIYDTLNGLPGQVQQQIVGWIGTSDLVAWRAFLETNRKK